MNGERVNIGIEGLDAMLNGGLLSGSICALVGTYGTGKTIFALHFMYEGLKNGEKVIFISLDEREDYLLEMMKDKGWDIEPHLDKTFFLLKTDPTDFNLSLNSIKNELPELIRKVGATRVAIDPISLYEGLFEDGSTRRTEMFRFTEMMRDLDCTLLLTSETDMNNQYSSRYNLIEYLSDTVILLRYVRPTDISEVHLVVKVVKMRRFQHSREIKPYEILEDRVVVYSEASVF